MLVGAASGFEALRRRHSPPITRSFTNKISVLETLHLAQGMRFCVSVLRLPEIGVE